MANIVNLKIELDLIRFVQFVSGVFGYRFISELVFCCVKSGLWYTKEVLVE